MGSRVIILNNTIHFIWILLLRAIHMDHLYNSVIRSIVLPHFHLKTPHCYWLIKMPKRSLHSKVCRRNSFAHERGENWLIKGLLYPSEKTTRTKKKSNPSQIVYSRELWQKNSDQPLLVLYFLLGN